MTLLDNKQCHQVRKGFIAFLLDDIACQQAMTSCKKGVYRFLTWWHGLSTFLVDSELILHNKSASQLGMLTLKKEHKSCIAQFYRLWAKLDGHFFSVLHPKKSDFFTSPKNSTLRHLEELFLHIWHCLSKSSENININILHVHLFANSWRWDSKIVTFTFYHHFFMKYVVILQ